MQISLHCEPGVTVFALHGFKDVQRHVSVDAAFHIHFDGAAKIASAAGDGAGERRAEIFAEVETELGELDGDVAGEIFGVHFFDHFDVAGADLAGSGFGRDVFAKMIEAHAAALVAEFAAGGKRFGERFTGDEAAREAMLHTAARDGVGDAALGRKPKNKIANQHWCSWDSDAAYPHPPHFAKRGGKLLKTNEASAKKRGKREQEAPT